MRGFDSRRPIAFPFGEGDPRSGSDEVLLLRARQHTGSVRFALCHPVILNQKGDTPPIAISIRALPPGARGPPGRGAMTGTHGWITYHWWIRYKTQHITTRLQGCGRNHNDQAASAKQRSWRFVSCTQARGNRPGRLWEGSSTGRAAVS